MRLLEGKCALVTGAGRNIGKAIALEMAKEGASIIVNELQDIDLAMGVVKEISKFGVQGKAVLADVSQPQQVDAMVRGSLSQFGKIDILVNNVGYRPHMAFTDLSNEVWQRTIDINLSGPFYCIKAVLHSMIEHKFGRIINLIGIIAHMGIATQAPSAATKAGLLGLTKTLAVELGPYGITVNGISPGSIYTERPEGYSKERLEARLKETPLKRLGETREVARGCVYLASDDGAFITGHTLCINGGRYQL